MTETCKNRTLKSQDVHQTWCFYKKEEPIQCSAKTQSQSFYDAFTAFLSSSCTVDLEENDVNGSLHSNAELRKLQLKDDKINLMRQTAANTGCNEEILDKRVNYSLENCVSAEKFVTNFWLAEDRPNIKKKLTESAISLSLADSNMSHDWPACKAYGDEYLSTLSSGTRLRNLRSRDIYIKCSQNERKTRVSRSTFLERSTLGANFPEELSCDEKKRLELRSFSSPYQQIKKFSYAGNFSRSQNSEIQFLRPRNLKLGNNVNYNSVSSGCQLQHKEEYRRKLRSAHDESEVHAVSKLCHTDRTHQNRLSSLRRRNSLTSNGHDLGNDCCLKYVTQKVICRPAFVVLEKMSKKKIEQMQKVMKMCTKESDVTDVSDIRKTSGPNRASDFPRNDDIVSTSANTRTDMIPKMPVFSRTDENEEDSNCTKADEVIGTLHSTKRETNLEGSQLCCDGIDMSVEGTALNSETSHFFENSAVGNSQSRNSQICEIVPLLNLQEVSNDLLNVINTKQGLETGGSNCVPELAEIIPSSVINHEVTDKREIQNTCISRTSYKFGFKKSLHEANSSGCLHTIFKTLDHHDFEPELNLSKIYNSSGVINVAELVDHSEVLGFNPLSIAVTSDTTALLKELPIAKSDILQDTKKSKAVDVFDQQDTDCAKDVPQTVDRVGVVITSLRTLNPSPSGPLRMKSQGKSAESKPAVNCDTQAQCTDNPEYFPKSSNIDKRKKKRFSNLQNDVLGKNMLDSISEYPKDCLKSIMTGSVQSTKAKKRKAECHVALPKVPGDQSDDADAYVPNFLTHSQFLVDESSLAEKWKEATDLEEWWLNDLGNWMNLSALGSTTSSSITSEKSTSSEDFRWCAMLADQSEWPEVELDCPTGFEESVDECNRNFPLSVDAEQGQALHGEDVNSDEFDMDKCEDSQLPETDAITEKFKCMKRTACRVGKKKQVQWLKLKETGSLSTRVLTTTAGREMELNKVANSELSHPFQDMGLSDNVAVASAVMEAEVDDKKHDQADKITTSFNLSQALKKSQEEKADNRAPSSPAVVGTFTVTCTADTNTTCTSSVASVILAPNDLHVNEHALFSCSPCDDSFSRTSSVTAHCHAPSETLFSSGSSVLSHCTSYMKLKCNPAAGSFRHNHSSSSVVPFSQNPVHSHFDSDSHITSFSQNLSDSHFDSNSIGKSFSDDPSFAYSIHPVVPHSHAASNSHFTHNVSFASFSCASVDRLVSTSTHEQLSRCQTVSSNVKPKCVMNSQDSSQRESETKGITTERTCGLVTIKETFHSNTERHVIPLTCSTMVTSSLAFDSAVTKSRNVGIGLNLDSSSLSVRTGKNYPGKTEQLMVNNEFFQKQNFVYNERKSSKICPTSSESESHEKDPAFNENNGDLSRLGFLAESKCESPLIRVGLYMQSRSQEHSEICSKDFHKDSQPSISCAGLYRRFSKLDQGWSCDSYEALDMVSENSSQDCQSESSSKPCRKDLGLPSPSSEDAFMYNDCNSDMCSWLAASMGLYTCDCGAAFSDSWSCQQHQSRCNAMIRI